MKITVTLTQAEAREIMRAASNTLLDRDDAIAVLGSAAAVDAACRAYEKIKRGWIEADKGARRSVRTERKR